jgi:hypothetical protein
LETEVGYVFKRDAAGRIVLDESLSKAQRSQLEAEGYAVKKVRPFAMICKRGSAAMVTDRASISPVCRESCWRRPVPSRESCVS